MMHYLYKLTCLFIFFLLFSNNGTYAQYLLTSADVSFNTTTGTITNYNNMVEKDIIIPDNFEGVAVTAIDDGVFFGFGLTNVVIPNSVKNIGEEAFRENDLISIVIPDSVTNISYCAFRENSLTSVTIPNSVTDIGEMAFYYNSITSITIPGSVVNIGEYAFGRNSLDSINIPNSVLNIGNGAFIENNLKNISFPDSLSIIPDNAFEDNDLMHISIPNSITSIGANAFNNNSLSKVTISNSTTFIGYEAFNNNPLSSIELPYNINGYGATWKNSDSIYVFRIENFTMSYKALVTSTPFLYSITYISNGGSHSNTIDGYTMESTDIILTDALKNGYTFEGWYNNESYTGNAISLIDSNSTGNIILWAKFSVNNFIATFEDFDGTVLKTDTVNFGNTALAPIINPVREGYEFTGWDNEFEVISNDITLTAQYNYNDNVNLEFENLNSIRIYPVPTNTHIIIEGLSDKTIRIINTSGIIVKEIKAASNKQFIDINNLAAGAYFVETDSFKQQIVISR